VILEVSSLNVRLCLIEYVEVQGVSLIFSPSMAAVREAVLFTKPACVGNSEYKFLLQFSIPYFIEQSWKADLQLVS
jgi:hypothetical protein